MSDSPTLPLVAEELSVTAVSNVTGKVAIRTVTEEATELAMSELVTEQVSVERIGLGREVELIPQIRTEGDVTIIPVIEERLVVRKQLFLLEEIQVRRTTSIEEVSVPLSIRRQKAVVERTRSEDPPT